MDQSLVVVDIGNSLIKIASFTSSPPGELPKPICVTSLPADSDDFTELDHWLPDSAREWLIGSVQSQTLQRLTEWLKTIRAKDSYRVVTHSDFSLRVEARIPAAVGIDRLAAALAANMLREPNKAAIVVDVGSAITIDVVSAEGSFLGGSIAPGLKLRLDALRRGTDKLPSVKTSSETPHLIGTDTESAMLAGAFWSVAVGIDGMVTRLAVELDSAVNVFLTGGGTQQLLPHITMEHRYEPHLVLSGLAMAKR
jgi:type III pantothenate kinase